MNDHCRPSAAYSSWREREGVILQQRAPELRTLCLGQLIQVLFEEIIPAQLQVNTKLEKINPTWGYSTPGSFWVWIRTCWNSLSEDLGTPGIYQSVLQGCFKSKQRPQSHKGSPGCAEISPEGQGTNRTPSLHWDTAPAQPLCASLC